MKAKLAKFYENNKYLLFLLLIVSVLAVIPLIYLPTMRGHDIFFHLQRIDALADEFAIGNFAPRLYSTLLNGAGYASPMFYGDLFLSIPALLVCAGMTVRSAYTFFQILIIYSTALTMYYSIVSMTRNKRSAFLGSVMYALSSYFFTDLLTRGALGESEAFVFLPLVFLGFYHIMYGERRKWFWLPVGLACMLACHTLTSVMAAAIVVLLTVCGVRQIIKKPVRLLWLGLSAAVFFALAADFIFPLLEQMGSTTFLSTDGYASTKWGGLMERALEPKMLFSDFNTQLETSWWMPNSVGFSGLLLGLLYLYEYRRASDRKGVVLLLVSFALLFMTSNLFPWDVVQDYVGVIQFPWRLLIFVTFFTAMSGARLFSKLNPKKLDMTFAYFVVLVSLFSFFVNVMPTYSTFYGYKINGEREYNYENNIGAAEYLPTTDEFERNNYYSGNYAAAVRNSADEIYSDGSLKAAFVREKGVLTVRFEGNQKENAYIDVPLVMYKGYTAILDGKTNLECVYGVYNRIRVYIGSATEGTIVFEYTGTKIQHFSRAVTIASVILLAVYLIIMRQRRKRRPTTLFVTDLDGTLFGADAEVSGRSRELINTAVSNGANFAVATARTPATLIEKLNGLDIRFPSVIMNGAAVYDTVNREYVCVNPIDEASAKMLAEVAQNTPGAMLYTVLEGDDGHTRELAVYYRGSTGEIMDKYISERVGEYKKFILTDDIPASVEGKNIIDFVVLTPEYDVKRIYDRIKNIPRITCWYCNSFADGQSFVEANAYGTSKAAMVRKIMKKYGFTEYYAFGDNRNDLSLIEDAEFSAVPENAEPLLKSRASAVIGANTEDSVARFIADCTHSKPKSSDTVTNS